MGPPVTAKTPVQRHADVLPPSAVPPSWVSVGQTAAVSPHAPSMSITEMKSTLRIVVLLCLV